jgi:hypothetical protein
LYTARHALNLYYAIIVLNSYQCTKQFSQQQLYALIYSALAKVVPRHAALCHGIHGSDTNNPSYVPLGAIDLAKRVSFRPWIPDEHLQSQLEILHDSPWPDQETDPPWKLVVYAQAESGRTKLQIAFVTHHALADGLSAFAFHADLLHTLQEVSAQSPETVQPVTNITIEHPPSWIAPVESLVKFTLSWGFLLGKVLEEYGPRFIFKREANYFTGEPCQLSDEFPYKTNIRLIAVEPALISSLLLKCKSKGISITVLLSAVLARALALAVTSAEAFTGSIDYSLRTVTGTDHGSMVNQVSGWDISYQMDAVSRLRYQDLWTDALWQEAANQSAQLRAHLTDCRTNNPIALLPYVSDHREYYRKKLGHKRDHTFDVSNLGVFDPKAPSNGAWSVERSIFTQGAAIVGAALNINVASVRDGQMTITFSWQEHILPNDLVSGTILHFESTLKTLV